MKTVIRLPNWVGDTLLALPAIEALCDLRREEVILAGRDLPLLLTRHLRPAATRLRLGRGDPSAAWLQQTAHLRRLGAQRGLLLAPSFSSALWLRVGGVPVRIGWPEQGRGFLLTHAVPRAPRGVRHLADEFAELARQAGASSVSGLPYLPESADEAEAAEALLRAGPWADRASTAFVALCPGALYGSAKRWPMEAYAELAGELARRGMGGVIVGTGADRGAAARILRAAASARWASAAGVGSIRMAAELMRRASVVISNDSGAMHLGASVGTSVVALFGPTDPGWTGPRGDSHAVLWDRLPCAPCFRRRCPYGEPSPCLAGIAPSRVMAAVLPRVRGSGADAPAGAAGAHPAAARARGRRALFLDRDGTLLELVPYLHDPAQVRLVRGAAEALREARAAGFLIVVVSNQSGIARGLFGPGDVDRVHARVRAALAEVGAAVDRFLYCPHHPDFGGRCDCRKPAPGLLRQAALELGIDLSRSLALGDTIEDLIAAQQAGCQPILVRTGYGAQAERERAGEIPPGTLRANDLPEAIRSFVRVEEQAPDRMRAPDAD